MRALIRYAFAPLFVAAALLALSGAAQAESTLRIRGEAGETLTRGGDFWWSDATSTFVAVMSNGSLYSRATKTGADFSVQFAAPDRRVLSHGTYDSWYPNYSPNEAWSRVQRYDDYAACDPRGRFQVRKLALTPAGAIRTAWVVWDLSCSPTAPLQHGDLRVNADTSLWQELPGDVWSFAGDSARFEVVAHSSAGAGVRFEAEALPVGGVFVDRGDGTARFAWKSNSVPAASPSSSSFQCRVIAIEDTGLRDTATTVVHVVPLNQLWLAGPPTHPLSPAGGTLASPNGAARILSQSFLGSSGNSVSIAAQGQQWNLRFNPPHVRPLEEGFYSSAVRGGSRTLLPELTVSRSGGNCSSQTGWFDVRKLTRNAGGGIVGWWLRFGSYCSPADSALVGELRYNVDTTLYVRAPANLFFAPGALARWTCSGISTIGRTVQLRFEGLPPGATVSGEGTADAALEWQVPPASATQLAITCIATDDRGMQARVVTRIEARTLSFLTQRTNMQDCATHDLDFRATELDGDFLASDMSYGAGSAARVNVLGQGIVDWAGPGSTPIREGRYPMAATEYTGADRLAGSMGINLLSKGIWSQPTSMFVRRFATDGRGNIVSLWATWSGGCSGRQTFSGEVRINADTTIVIDAPAYSVVERGRALRVPVSASRVGGGAMQLRAEHLPAGAFFVAGPGNSGAVEWPVASALGDTTVSIIAVDANGAADTLDILLRVVAPRRFALRLLPYQPWNGLPAGDYSFDASNSDFLNYSSTGYHPNYFCYQPGRSWSVEFQTPDRRKLTPGVYDDIQPWGFEASLPLPVMGVRVNGNRIPGLGERMHVRKITFGAWDLPAQAWFTFDTRFEGALSPGELRYGDPDTALYMEAPADRRVVAGTAATFEVRAISTVGALPVTLAAEGLPAGAHFVDRGDGSGAFEWTAPNGDSLAARVVFRAQDAAGRVDSAVTHLKTVPPARLVTDRIADDAIGRGNHHAYEAPTCYFEMRSQLEHGVLIEAVGMNAGWVVAFAGPNDERLEPGRRYTNAQPYPPYPANMEPSLYVLDINGQSSWYENAGTENEFTVHDVRYGEDGHVSAIRASFRQVHEDTTSISGEVLYGALDSPVATLVQRLRAECTAGRVTLAWRVRSDVPEGLVIERSDGGSEEWVTLASLAADPAGEVSFEDRNVLEGQAYRYRLVPSRPGAGVLDEVEVRVPAHEPFGLHALGPNPARGRLSLRLGASDDRPVELRLLDLAGRTVARSTLERTESGQDVSWALPAALRPGVYLLRAQAGSHMVTRRIVIVK